MIHLNCRYNMYFTLDTIIDIHDHIFKKIHDLGSGQTPDFIYFFRQIKGEEVNYLTQNFTTTTTNSKVC